MGFEQHPKERWESVSRLYHAALARPASERATFLKEACSGHEELRSEVASMLEHEAAGGFLDQSGLADIMMAAEAAEIDDLIGRDIDRYRVTVRIGAGGMGVVYKAVDAKFQRSVARFTTSGMLVSECKDRQMHRCREQFVTHYHRERNHQGLANELMTVRLQNDGAVPCVVAGELVEFSATTTGQPRRAEPPSMLGQNGCGRTGRGRCVLGETVATVCRRRRCQRAGVWEERNGSLSTHRHFLAVAGGRRGPAAQS